MRAQVLAAHGHEDARQAGAPQDAETTQGQYRNQLRPVHDGFDGPAGLLTVNSTFNLYKKKN